MSRRNSDQKATRQNYSGKTARQWSIADLKKPTRPSATVGIKPSGSKVTSNRRKVSPKATSRKTNREGRTTKWVAIIPVIVGVLTLVFGVYQWVLAQSASQTPVFTFVSMQTTGVPGSIEPSVVEHDFVRKKKLANAGLFPNTASSVEWHYNTADVDVPYEIYLLDKYMAVNFFCRNGFDAIRLLDMHVVYKGIARESYDFHGDDISIPLVVQDGEQFAFILTETFNDSRYVLHSPNETRPEMMANYRRIELSVALISMNREYYYCIVIQLTEKGPIVEIKNETAA